MSIKNKILKNLFHDYTSYIIIYLILILVITNLLAIDYAMGNRKELVPFLPRNQTFLDEEYHNYIGDKEIIQEMNYKEVNTKTMMTFKILGILNSIHLTLLIIFFSMRMYTNYKNLIQKLDIMITDFIRYIFYRIANLVILFIITLIIFLRINRRILLKLINSKSVFKVGYLEYNRCPYAIIITILILFIIDLFLFIKATRYKKIPKDKRDD